MMKRLITTCIVLLATLSAMAAPAKRGQWRTLTLANGKTVRAELMGDEWAHYWRTADGVGYLETEAGAPCQEIDIDEILRQGHERRMEHTRATKIINRAPARRAPGRATPDHIAINGSRRGLVILVQFKDTKFADGHDKALYERILNEENFSKDNFKGSVYDYFKAQSNGKFLLNFDVVGPVTLDNNHDYYGGEEGGSHDKNPEAMITEACKAVENQVDFSKYDWDDDKEVEEVFVLYAGLGQANGGDASTIWPHKSAISNVGIKFGEMTVNVYACAAELQPAYDQNGNIVTTIDGIGTFCHEFSHCLGYPDFYDTDGGNSGGEAFGTGAYDLMCAGNYNGSGFIPSGYTSYEKWCAGWIDPVELDTDTVIENVKPLSENGTAYVIYNKAYENEYYLLENRQQTRWDSKIPGKGLLIYHADYSESAWNWNRPNVDPGHQRLFILHADNGNNGKDAPYPYNGNDSLTNNSEPAGKLFNVNTDGRKYLNRGITGIRQNDDKTVSFTFNAVSKTLQGGAHEGSVFYESFDDCESTGGNDDTWGGIAGSGDFLPDNKGWKYNSGKAFGGKRCAKFGLSSGSANLVSPEISIDRETTFSFKAAPWSTEKPTLAVAIQSGEATITGDESFELTPKQWTECVTTITPTAGATKVKIKFTATKNAFFLDEVDAYTDTTTGIAELQRLPLIQGAGRIYNLGGQFVGTDLSALPKGLYIVNGKKVVK